MACRSLLLTRSGVRDRIRVTMLPFQRIQFITPSRIAYEEKQLRAGASIGLSCGQLQVTPSDLWRNGVNRWRLQLVRT